jgi:hypothetical protein
MGLIQQIGPYEIVREIGRGGMGVVYLAREPEEGTLVALKVLPENCHPDKEGLGRFRREAATVMKVRHPNIVPIYSVGSANGTWFIAMKFIEGTSLDNVIDDRFAAKTSRYDDRTVLLENPEEGEAVTAGVVETTAEGRALESQPRLGPPISWIGANPHGRRGPSLSYLCDAPKTDEVKAEDDSVASSTEPAWVHQGVVIIEKVARALDYLHTQGIVHRDVKPGNIIVDKHGEPWLVDFGLVRDLLARRGPRTEGIVGTFQYMAPEQSGRNRHEAVDGRCDIYALGVTLYEIATLQRPYDGDDARAILRAARRPPVPPRKINPRVSKAFQDVILKAMERNPADRYQTGNALADELERLRTVGVQRPNSSFFTRLRRFGGRNPRISAALIALVFLVIGLAGFCIDGALGSRRRMLDCRAEADRAFERRDFRTAADGYRLYLKLGGTDDHVQSRLRACEAIEAQSPR